jgi:hypothetical protein
MNYTTAFRSFLSAKTYTANLAAPSNASRSFETAFTGIFIIVAECAPFAQNASENLPSRIRS